jgi:hypothetical protein
MRVLQVWSGSKSARRGTHLEAPEPATLAGDGGRWRGVAQDDGEQFASMGRRGRGEEAAGENPHHNAKLLECLLDGRERRSDGNDGDRSEEAAAVEASGS